MVQALHRVELTACNAQVAIGIAMALCFCQLHRFAAATL
jgi:hypothetical protein